MKSAYKPGSYSATATSHGGPLTVEVTVDENTIKDIKLLEFHDTVMVGDTAFATIREQILTHQTLNVDLVSGAAISSAAVRQAVTKALDQAGADIDTLKAKAIAKAAPGQLHWETDVLVIGSGLAGIAAAIEAADHGAAVIMVDRLGYVGGTSALSAGLVYAAGTAIQAKNHIEDSAEKFFKDWMMLAKRAKDEYVEEEFIRYIADHSAENIEWLQTKGVLVMDDLAAAGIYEGRNIPRIHHTEGGGYMIKHLFATATGLGVDTHANTRVMELIKEGNSVVGAKAVDKAGNEIAIKAKAVIVAAGGLAGNRDMMAKYFPQYTDYINSSVNIGDSIKLGEAAEADIIVKNAAQIFHTLITEFSLGFFTPECIYVTPEGERYVDEAEYLFTRTRALNELGFGDTHMIVPHIVYDKHKAGIDKALKIGKAFQADTVAELANRMKMKPDVLQRTIERYNEFVKAGKDSDFHKPSEYLHLLEAPYIGLDLTANINDTYVSMRININAQVVGTHGDVIKGLYAVGAAAAAQTMNQEYIGSGAALLNGLTFGRVAGVHAAATLG